MEDRDSATLSMPCQGPTLQAPSRTAVACSDGTAYSKLIVQPAPLVLHQYNITRDLLDRQGQHTLATIEVIRDEFR